MGDVDGVHTRKCGTLIVHAIRDATLSVPLGNFVGAQPDLAARLLGAEGDGQMVPVALNCFLLEAQDGRTCLLDTGVGTAIPGVEGALVSKLAAMGRAKPERIFLSHFHIDHVGGLVSRAELVDEETEILVPRAEFDYWTQPGFPLGAPQGQGRSRPVVAAMLKMFGERLTPVDPDVAPLEGAEQVPLPGHTPGHTGFRVGDLLIWGDIIHCAALQCAQPEWCYIADVDSAASAPLRRKMFEETAASGQLVGGMHLPGSGLGYLSEENGAYRFVQL